MSDTMFTPGPWELFEVGGKHKHLCPSKNGTSILTVSLEYISDDGEPDYFGSVYYPADAHLIAAAPDMYEALEHALSDMDTIDEICRLAGVHKFTMMRSEIDAALTKARGET